MLGRIVPACEWLRTYKKADCRKDLVAGLIVAVMLVPQAMAYATLAGLPPVMGLYASTVPLFIYAVFGTSRHLAVGPVAIISMVIYAQCREIAAPGSPEYLEAVLALCVLVGFIQVLMGLFRAGFIVNFLSHAVISGLTSAAAILIALSQMKHVLGVPLHSHHSIFGTLSELAARIHEVHPPTLLFGLAGTCALLLLKRRWPRFPSALLLVLAATVAVRLFRLDLAGIAIVGEVPRGLPRLLLPGLDPDLVSTLLPAALIIVLVGFVESISITQLIAARERYRVDANQELRALGLANLASAVTGGYPVTGGFSRTAVNYQAGARTGMASFITAALILLTLLFFTPLFHYLPNAVLGAIVIAAVVDLVDVRGAITLFRLKRTSGLSLLLTFIVTLSFGIEIGVFSGTVFALLMFIWRSAHPHTAELGYVNPGLGFRNIRRYPDATTFAGILILRVDASLYFANMAFLEDLLRRAVYEKPGLRWILMDFSGVNDIDGCAVQSFGELMRAYHDTGIAFALAAVKGPVRDVLERSEWPVLLGKHMEYASVQQALDGIQE